jgi:tetratricopeptide (TPR) repeat protein
MTNKSILVVFLNLAVCTVGAAAFTEAEPLSELDQTYVGGPIADQLYVTSNSSICAVTNLKFESISQRTYSGGRLADCVPGDRVSSNPPSPTLAFKIDDSGLCTALIDQKLSPQRGLDCATAIYGCEPFPGDLVSDEIRLPVYACSLKLTRAREEYLRIHSEVKDSALLFTAISPDLVNRYPGVLLEDDIYSANNVRAIDKRLLCDTDGKGILQLKCDRVDAIFKTRYYYQWQHFIVNHKSATRDQILEQCHQLDIAYANLFCITPDQPKIQNFGKLAISNNNRISCINRWLADHTNSAEDDGVLEASRNDVDAQRFADARIELEWLIRRHPNEPEPYLLLSLCCLETSDFESSIEAATSNLALRQNPTAYNIRGTARKRQHKYRLAVEDYSRAIAMKPDEAQYYKNRAQCQMALKKTKDALRDLNRAIRLQPNFRLAYQERSKLFADTHRKTEAASDERRYQQLANVRQDFGYFEPRSIPASLRSANFIK